MALSQSMGAEWGACSDYIIKYIEWSFSMLCPMCILAYGMMRDVILVSGIDFRFSVKYRHTLCSNMLNIVRRLFDFFVLTLHDSDRDGHR